jgi:ABC-2 type transport system ATP-binding protein
MVIRKSATAISLNNIYVPIRNDKTSQNAITFDVLHGNHFALLGLPKTGKSTIVKVLAGLVKVASGTGFVLDYALEDPHILNVPSIGFLHQEINWSGSLTVKDIFQLAARQYQQLDHHLMELVKIAGLQEKQHVPIKSLSVKERQLVGLVSLGIQDLDIMIMDDPADNLNGKDRTDVLDFLAYIARDKTLFFTTSHLDDVHHCATHVAILQDGVIIAQVRYVRPCGTVLPLF